MAQTRSVAPAVAADEPAAERLPRAPRREEIAGATVSVLRQGPPYKANVLVVDAGGGPVVVKDFAAKAWWARLLGRVQIGHECRAYRWLGRRPSIPAFLGRIDAHALAIEKIDGRLLASAPERRQQARAIFRRLRAVAEDFAAAGFLHLDFRARKNVLLKADGRVVAIDLAGSLWLRPGSPAHRLCAPLIRRIYWNALRKWRKLLTTGRWPGDDSFLHRFLLRLRRPHRWRGGRPPAGGTP